MLTVDGVVDDRATADGWWETRWRAMGTEAHVVGLGGPGDAARWACRRVEELERCWSRFRPDSELVALNASPAPVVPVSADLTAALRRAVAAWALTDGWFDPSVHDALVAAGYDRTIDEVRRRGACRTASAVPSPGLAGVEVDEEHGTVTRPPGLHLDLGGIGKGLAADVLAVDLVAAGVRAVAVSLGGDVRVAGHHPSGRWQVPVAVAGRSWAVEVDDGAVVASTTTERRWATDAGPAHHLIDPCTGRPASGTVAAVVVTGPEAWWAECLATAALVARPAAGAALLERARARAWFVR